MLKKLRIKFVMVIMSIVLGMLLIIFGLVYHFTDVNMTEHRENTLHTLVQAAKNPEAMMHRQDVGMPYILIRVDRFGQLLASGVTGYDIQDEDFVRELVEDIYDIGRVSGVLKAYDLQYYCEVDLAGQYFALVDISAQEQSLQSLVTIGIWVGVGAIIAFFGISLLLAYWVVKPVDKAWKQQKQFISDASHELKTPLTVIMSNAELMGGEEVDPEDARQYAQNIALTAQRMRRLTEGMLELSRVDNGQVKKSFEALDLSALVEQGILPFEPAFYEKHMRLESSIAPNIHVRGNAQYLSQVVDILLENALKYSDPGIVHVTLQRYGRGHCLLAVANPGTPIAPEDRQAIFERFYRCDTARTHNGSFGLGLAIAQSTVREHDGDVWVESNETGNCFCVTIPTI